jgi:pimeloyl-ACP methyl ester carboxylesterase
VLLGDLDLEDIAANNEAMAERIPGATFELLQQTAHVPHLEGHARCREAIRDFLAS